MSELRSVRRVVLGVVSAIASAANAAPQTTPVFESLHSFAGATEGAAPQAAPLLGADGNWYGVTGFGGAYDAGVVYRTAPDGSALTALHSFAHDGNGAQPIGVIQGQDGALFGVTRFGGPLDNGVVFRVEVDGSGYQVLLPFDFATGHTPGTPLVEGSDATLYGTTVWGGAHGFGTLFRLAPDGTGFSAIHDFDNGNTTGAPSGQLVFGSDGLIYGATYGGNAPFNSRGVLYQVAVDGTGYTILHDTGTLSFNPGPGPWVTEASDGALYVADFRGGANDEGRIYKLQRDGTGFTELYGFDQALTGMHFPNGPLLEGMDGALYGAAHGGAHDGGVLFKLQKNGSGAAALFDFEAATTGSGPNGRLLQLSDSTLIGACGSYGPSGRGTLYELQPDGSGHAIVFAFGQSDGKLPLAGVIEGSDGRLYGVAEGGGSNDAGTLFRMELDGSGYSVLHRFDAAVDGARPTGELLQASDGALYGMTTEGGANGGGTLFTIQTDGSGFLVLRDLANTLRHDVGPLIEGVDGKLYGVAPVNGSDGQVFKVNKDGTAWSVLALLTSINRRGQAPFSGLLQASDGALYGAASNGGNNSASGSLYKLNTDGTGFTPLLKFDGTGGAVPGKYPRGELIEGQDGALYGTTFRGGSFDEGTVFEIQTDGTGFMVLHDFDGVTDGSLVGSGLLQRADGSLWGVASSGATKSHGTLFTLQDDGTGFTVVHDFDPFVDGWKPFGRLFEAHDGELYGSTQFGGDFVLSGGNGFGLLFRLHVDCTASWSNYGTGFPGTNGIPSLTAQAPPVLGTTLTVDAGNSAPSATLVAVLVGTQPAQLPMKKGGDLLVVPDLFLILPLPVGGMSLAETLANDPSLCGFEWFVQTLVVDPGAAKGQAASAGLKLLLGY